MKLLESPTETSIGNVATFQFVRRRVALTVFPLARFEMTNSSIKKWFRFSLRKLLIIVAAAAVIFACYSYLTSGYRRSRASSRIIVAAGGTVSWSGDSCLHNATFPSIGIVDLQNCKLTDKEYAALAKIPDYFSLMIDSKTFDQHTMRKLAEIEYLSGLFLEPGPVAEKLVLDFQKQRPDIMVTVGLGLNSESGYREYPRPND